MEPGNTGQRICLADSQEENGCADNKAVAKAENDFILELISQAGSYLNAITGFSELLGEEESDDERNEYICQINELSREASALLAEMAERL